MGTFPLSRDGPSGEFQMFCVMSLLRVGIGLIGKEIRWQGFRYPSVWFRLASGALPPSVPYPEIPARAQAKQP